MKINELYGAYIYYPSGNGNIKFEWQKLNIREIHKTMVETEHYYFVSPHHSTRYFDEDMLGRENKISENLTTYYSDDLRKCIDWLTLKRKRIIDELEFDLNRMYQSKISEGHVL